MPVSRCFRQGTDQSRRTATPSHGHQKPDRGYVYYNAPIRPGGTAPAGDTGESEEKEIGSTSAVPPHSKIG